MCSSVDPSLQDHYINEDLPAFQDSPLVRARSCPLDSDPESELISVASPVDFKPDLEVLRLHAPPVRSESSEEFLGEGRNLCRAMSAPPDPNRSEEAPTCDDSSLHEKLKQSLPPGLPPSTQDEQLKKTAALAIEASTGNSEDVKTEERVDSGRGSAESLEQLESEQSPPAKVDGKYSTRNTAFATPHDELQARSPSLRKVLNHIESSTTLRSRSKSPSHNEAHSHPRRKESLPGFQQLAQLANLADIASQQASQHNVAAQPVGRAHSRSISSATSASPMLPYHRPISYANNAQTSPISYHVLNTRSPTSTASESPFNYGSPYHFQPQAYYAERRSSAATESSRQFPSAVPSLPSQSSGESHGTSGSSVDGYSTSRTTPLESTGDAIHQRILPPPVPGMAVVPAAGFKCDWPGCTAQAFQTQYLLSSHRNVHSQNRPHYCPVKECPRSEGGKGFKRKNEMIRHGLVHNSPGYICPFCPDREHRYPRPDNLQRHVRVHHVDKDRDDPALREVLAQRSEGSLQKQRRRRAPGHNVQVEC